MWVCVFVVLPCWGSGYRVQTARKSLGNGKSTARGQQVSIVIDEASLTELG